MFPIEAPFKTYTGLDGRPLTAGKVYIGQVGTDPTVPANQIPVFWDADMTIPAVQPLRTNAGYIVRFGTPSNVFVSIAYSEMVTTASDVAVFYAQDSTEFSFASTLPGPGGASLIGYGDTNLGSLIKNSIGYFVGSIALLRTLDTSLYTKAFVSGYYAPGDGGGGTYFFESGSLAPDNNGTVISSNGGGVWRRINDAPVTQYVFGAVGDGVTDDTVNMNKWLNWAVSGGYGNQYGIHGKKGRHRITGTGLKVVVADSLPDFTSDGATNFVLTGTASTYIDFSVSGGSGQTSQAEWGGIGIDPTSKVADSVGLLVRGLCSVKFRNWRFNKLSNSVLMHNDKVGSFTELVVLDNPYFDTSVDGFLRYRVTLGNQSFRSSGVIGGKGNIGLTCDPIVFEANSVNYFGHCDITVWNYKPSCNLITNNATQQSLIGNITAEPLALAGGQAQELNKLFLAVGNSTVFLFGHVAGWAFNSNTLFKGTLTLCREFFNMADAGQQFLPENDSGSIVTTAPGQSFTIKYSPGIELPYSPDSAILTVCVKAPGYTWKGIYSMRTGATPNVVNVTALYTPDLFQDVGVTYGAMTVSQGTSSNINLSNANSLPTGTVLTYNIAYTHALIPNI